MPSFCAARSTMPSVSATAIGWPTARYWQVTFLLVNTTCIFARYFWCRYGPPVRLATWLPSMTVAIGPDSVYPRTSAIEGNQVGNLTGAPYRHQKDPAKIDVAFTTNKVTCHSRAVGQPPARERT